jgi:hypothetical protein
MHLNISRRSLIASMACAMTLLLPACNGDKAAEPVVTPLAPPPAPPVAARQSDMVQAWSLKAAESYNASGQFPIDQADPTKPEAERRPNWNVEMATVHVAMYDAIMAIVETHRPFLVTPTATAPLTARAQEAAVMAAAYGVMKVFWPDRGTVYQPLYDERLASLNSGAQGDEVTRGIALGAEVATRVLAARSPDGRMNAMGPFVSGTLPGQYRLPPIPLASPYIVSIKPFSLISASQFRGSLRGPLVLGSAEYVADFNETRDWGSATSTLRSADQTAEARFHTEAPNIHWPRNLSQFSHWTGSGGSPLTLAEDARLSAMIWVSLSDTITACWDAKFHHWFWRPHSAIPLADTDGNATTTAVPGWVALGPVPPHPEYPAAHTCVASAVAETLASYFDTRTLTFTLDARTINPAVSPHQYASVDEFVRSNFMGRIWGGQHFRHSLDDGVTLGRLVSDWVRDHHFHPR